MTGLYICEKLPAQLPALGIVFMILTFLRDALCTWYGGRT